MLSDLLFFFENLSQQERRTDCAGKQEEGKTMTIPKRCIQKKKLHKRINTRIESFQLIPVIFCFYVGRLIVNRDFYFAVINQAVKNGVFPFNSPNSLSISEILLLI